MTRSADERLPIDCPRQSNAQHVGNGRKDVDRLNDTRLHAGVSLPGVLHEQRDAHYVGERLATNHPSVTSHNKTHTVVRSYDH